MKPQALQLPRFLYFLPLASCPHGIFGVCLFGGSCMPKVWIQIVEARLPTSCRPLNFLDFSISCLLGILGVWEQLQAQILNLNCRMACLIGGWLIQWFWFAWVARIVFVVVLVSWCLALVISWLLVFGWLNRRSRSISFSPFFAQSADQVISLYVYYYLRYIMLFWLYRSIADYSLIWLCLTAC